VSLTVTHKHALRIWFTLSYAMMKTLLRLAAVWDTKQAGDLRGYTVQFIASSSALVLMTQNGNIYRPLTQTAICSLPRYRSKHIAENSQWISQTTHSLPAPLMKRASSKVPRGRKHMHRKARRKTHSTNCVNIESRVTYNAVWACERFMPSRMAQWAVYYKALVPVRTYMSIYFGHWPQHHNLLEARLDL